jgi:cytochrome bd-type quinol oxidase subunit 1
MWQRYKHEQRLFWRMLDINYNFAKLCSIPVSFIATVVGFLMTATGKHWDITGILGKNAYDLLDNLEDGIINVIHDEMLNDIFLGYSEMIIELVCMCFLGLYMQLLAYLIMQLILYFNRNKCTYSGLESSLPRFLRKFKIENMTQKDESQ